MRLGGMKKEQEKNVKKKKTRRRKRREEEKEVLTLCLFLVKKANKSMEKWKDIYDDKEYMLKEPNETRRRGQHENVVRKVTDPYRVPEELNPSISKHSYRSDYRGRP